MPRHFGVPSFARPLPSVNAGAASDLSLICSCMATTSDGRPIDLHDVAASFLLHTQNGDGQCVIAVDRTHENKPRYVLITNHHVLPEKETLAKSCLIGIGGKKFDPIKPDKKISCYFYSCCGPDSVWDTPSHVPLPGQKKAGCCPRNEDWAVVILDKTFAEQICTLTGMECPDLVHVPHRKTGNDISVFERSDTGKVTPRSVQPNFEPLEDETSIQHKIQNCISRFRIPYPYTVSGNLGAGCSGGPIFMIASSKRFLLGIHCSSPEDPDHRSHCFGLSTNFIITSLYCGGLDIECSLVSTLAFLKHQETLPPAVVLEQVSKSIVEHVIESREEGLLYKIEILEFILTKTELASSPNGLLSALKLLKVLLSLFESGSDNGTVIGKETLENDIYPLCTKLLPVLRTMVQSDAAKANVSLLQDCYDAYVKTLEFVRQNDIRCEVEKAEQRFREALMSQLEENRLRTEELNTNYGLTLEQLKAENAELNEENQLQTRKLHEQKTEIEDLAYQLIDQRKGYEELKGGNKEMKPFRAESSKQKMSALVDLSTDITSYLDPAAITPLLHSKRLLTTTQLSCLNSKQTRTDKNLYILELINAKNVEVFIQCLRQTSDDVVVHGELADKLDS